MIDQTILKAQWERGHNSVEIDMPQLRKIVSSYSKSKIVSMEMLTNGCGNTNYKINFFDHGPIVLRLYVRDTTALLRELSIYKKLQNKVPVPIMEYYDLSCAELPYPFALISFIDGILLRDLIFSGEETSICDTVYQAGMYLNELRKIEFSRSGFLNENLQVTPFSENENYAQLIQDLLTDEKIAQILGNELLIRLRDLVDENSDLLLSINDINLTHGDYDPSNILVDRIGAKWQVTGILDWEFTFAGHSLFDIGTFLRFSHRLPTYFKASFIAGYEKNSEPLPNDWEKKSKLLDTLNLLTILQAKNLAIRPAVKKDIMNLINNTLQSWQAL